MKINQLTASIFFSLMLYACDSSERGSEAATDQSATAVQNLSASVTAVNYSGESGNYNFSVTVESSDTGCSQYADWWEVFRPDGTLIYRRILAHSHVSEQPFTRSGGPVSVTADEEIIIRAHMNNLGYGTQVFRGNIEQGLSSGTLDAAVATELETTQPLPESCTF